MKKYTKLALIATAVVVGSSAHADVAAVATDLSATAGTVVGASAGVITAGLGMFAVKFGGAWLVRMIRSFTG